MDEHQRSTPFTRIPFPATAARLQWHLGSFRTGDRKREAAGSNVESLAWLERNLLCMLLCSCLHARHEGRCTHLGERCHYGVSNCIQFRLYQPILQIASPGILHIKYRMAISAAGVGVYTINACS